MYRPQLTVSIATACNVVYATFVKILYPKSLTRVIAYTFQYPEFHQIAMDQNDNHISSTKSFQTKLTKFLAFIIKNDHIVVKTIVRFLINDLLFKSDTIT